MKARPLMLVRRVTQSECHWLDREFLPGDIVYVFPGCTYGCVSSDGIACTLSPEGDTPFFELPENSVTERQ